jgi:hypothetical protein
MMHELKRGFAPKKAFIERGIEPLSIKHEQQAQYYPKK